MTDAAFTVRLEDTAVIARLNEIAGRIDNMAPAMRAIGEALTESTKQRFSDSSGPDGQPWARHAAATVLGRLEQITGSYVAYSNVKTRKEGRLRIGDKKGAFNKDGALSQRTRAKMESWKPLVDTGMLQDTIRYQLLPGGKGVEIGTNRFAGEWTGGAAVHQFGSKDGKIPARPFLGISAGDRVEVLAVLDRFLEQAIALQSVGRGAP